MITRFLVAAAILIASPALGLAQDDFFFAFGSGADASSSGTALTSDGTGSVFVYSAAGFEFNQFEVNFTTNAPDVIQITTAEVFNPVVAVVFGTPFARFNTPVVADTDATVDNPITPSVSGFLAGISVTEATGVGPLTAGDDPLFDGDVGPDGAFPIARVDFEILGEGVVDFVLSVDGVDGFANVTNSGQDVEFLTPTLGAATLTVSAPPAVVPEPSSAILLILGSLGMAARRKRA